MCLTFLMNRSEGDESDKGSTWGGEITLKERVAKLELTVGSLCKEKGQPILEGPPGLASTAATAIPFRPRGGFAAACSIRASRNEWP